MSGTASPISGIVKRRLLEVASERLEDEPVLALQGPRTVGKSTLLAELAYARGVAVVDLDEPATRAAVLADPDTFVEGPSPVCIDEYQHVPAVLDAIKAQLNRDLRPGPVPPYDTVPARPRTGRAVAPAQPAFQA